MCVRACDASLAGGGTKESPAVWPVCHMRGQLRGLEAAAGPSDRACLRRMRFGLTGVGAPP